MKYILPLFLLLFKFGFSQQLNYSIISTNKGLPSSQVYDILQDKQGYMWFATDHGVARYDGKEFITFTTADGLPDNTVLRMCEDKKGRIWFATLTNELFYWEDNHIHHPPLSGILHKKMPTSAVIRHFYVDSTDCIWIGGLRVTYVFRPGKDDYSLEQLNAPLDNSGTNFRLFSIEGKKVIIGGRLPYDPHSDDINKTPTTFHATFNSDSRPNFRYEVVDVSFPNTLTTMESTSCVRSARGTYYFSLHNFLFIIEKGKQVVIKKLEHDILNLSMDHKNGLWIGFYKGGVSYYKNCDLESLPLSILENYSVDDVCLDHEGGAWLATLEKGVLYIPSTAILVYSTVPYLNDRITFINNVNNTIYLNTFNNNICKEEQGKFVPDPYLIELSKIHGKLVDINFINDTTYLSFNLNLLRLAPELLYPKMRQTVKDYRSGINLIKLENNNIWVIGVGGIRRWLTYNDSLIYFLSPARIAKALAYRNTILLGTKKGLYQFTDNKFIHLAYLSPMLNYQISDMIMDKEGTIWIATTGNGVLQLKGRTVLQLTEKDGLISNSCNSITPDMYGNIWVGTNHGLSCILYSVRERKYWSIKNITEQTGLNSNEITKLLAFKNTLWVGTTWGLSSLQISEITKPVVPSPVYISFIGMDNTPVKDQHVFPYNENNLKLSLQGLTFKDRTDHRYRYRLNGLDTTWQETKSDEILFNNLGPGTYTFEAQVANTDNLWSTKPATYSFTINKPFWSTWWFILIEIIVLILIIYLIVTWRTHVVHKKEQEKLRINKLLAEYQMKALTAQMNPHFIFNAINSIQNFIIQNHATLAYDYLIKFSKLIRMVLNNSNEKEISIRQELDTLAIYIELEQLRFKDSFDYQLKVDPQLELDTLMIPSLLLQPYIENAIWHGLMPLKTHKGIITLSIQQEKELLKICVTDNGVGRQASDQLKKKIRHHSHRSVGMELTGKRIELFGQANEFSIQIIDNYDESNNSTGTTVEIVLPMIEMY